MKLDSQVDQEPPVDQEPSVDVELKVESVLAEFESLLIEPRLKRKCYIDIVRYGGFNRATFVHAFVLAQLAHDYQPITVRGLMYRAVAVGLFPDTDDSYYQQTMRTMLKLRR